jgi:hypothetical protein
MAVLRDRNGDTAGPAAKLEDRPARATREATEPLDVGPSLERRVIEVVERREARRLGGIALSAVPVTGLDRRAPPSLA